MKDYNLYWERCWKEESPAELTEYLAAYYEMKIAEIDIFKAQRAIKVCDAACGFGAYSLAFASNGFQVYSFDISDTAVAMTKTGLMKYGLESDRVKVASILDSGYGDSFFDGVIVHAVIDHLTLEDANAALKEMLRITKPNGLVLITFDIAEEADYAEEHTTFEDGTMEYAKGSRQGLLFRPYDWDMIEEFLKDHTIIHRREKAKRERIVILKKLG